jgi:hypothetical protein
MAAIALIFVACGGDPAVDTGKIATTGDFGGAGGATTGGSATGGTAGATTSAAGGTTASSTSGAGGAAGGGATSGAGGGGTTGSGSGGGDAQVQSVKVHLTPQGGGTGTVRANFAVPLAPGALFDESRVRVLAGGVEIPAARRALARRPSDSSLRSVQLQFDVDPAQIADVEVRVGEIATTAALSLVPVADTLVTPDGEHGPKVWALLPPSWLSESGVVGPEIPSAEVAGTPYATWDDLCDYSQWGISAFLAQKSKYDVWLYDRGTIAYRGHARRGDLGTLETAYRETAIYRNGITGAGASLKVPVPGREQDLRYHYTQNLAIHYLLTGDDRFRETAELVAARVNSMWDPSYDGSSTGDGVTERWTERHAGFSLLAEVWAAMVSDDRADEFRANADAHVDAYLHVQASYPAGYADPDARCFAHAAIAHAEPWGYFGCSPWMSAILADGLDAYAAERGGARADAARSAIVKLGRALARDGREPGSGRPYYWMGVGTPENELDDYEEHWGETAYVVAMAYHYDGKQDATLAAAVSELVAGLASYGEAPHMRSFNWQCRSAVATPWYMLR